ncbi:uncharacterized protein [Cicer arietinum]|uniref:Uncharacterized protein LOC101495789 isoform X1 n=1 Tax=Cicer arietinum TaxID=3827 RepID=A0A1S3E7G6_CICAR|nr:uncharacterized protein LOC101495789 isoform X1 [Cicer arietinum]
MVFRVHKRTLMYRNLPLLRSITYSRSHRNTSIVLDATDYIKQKLEELNKLPIPTPLKIVDYDPMPKLKVVAQEEGFVIKVLSERSCQGLLVFILEAFEELGLEVLQARVSCVDNFCLEAVGNRVIANYENNQDTRKLDAQLVEQVVFQAIQNWRKVTQKY